MQRIQISNTEIIKRFKQQCLLCLGNNDKFEDNSLEIGLKK